jgi:uncharacterized RmlC-like cupin family protein
MARYSPSEPDVTVVRGDSLSSDTAQTSGLERFEAISAKRLGAKSLWMGLSVLTAGMRTGVHHHGESETALYVLSGTGRWWIGDRLDVAREALAGDFVFIPPNVVHWEENGSPDTPVVMIVARSTQDAIVVNLDNYGPPEISELGVAGQLARRDDCSGEEREDMS